SLVTFVTGAQSDGPRGRLGRRSSVWLAVAGELEREAAAGDKRRGEAEEPAGEIAGRLFDVADDERPDKAADVADRVDERDASRGGCAAQELRRQAPKRPKRAPDAERGETEREKRERRAVTLQQSAEDEPDAARERRHGHVPAALARLVGMIADQHHRDRGDQIR